MKTSELQGETKISEPDTSVYPYLAWVCPYCGNESDENSMCCDEHHREYLELTDDEENF